MVVEGSQQSGEVMKGATQNASSNEGIINLIYVAIYDVSELENDPELKGEKIDETGSEKWNHTGTYGMKVALESMGVWEYNGKKYKFVPQIVGFDDIVNKKVLSKRDYKLFLAPGDDDYFDDQRRENGKELVKEIKKFVENGITLHYKYQNRSIDLGRFIGDRWSIIMQDNINGEGRIVLFGCHPEHKTWKWGSGQVIENEDYSQYIYAYPKNATTWQEIKSPNVTTYDIVQEAAKWIVEPMLNVTSDNSNSFNNTNHSHPIPVPSPKPVSVNTNQQTTNSTNSNNEEADTSKNSLQSSSAEEVAVENEEENK